MPLPENFWPHESRSSVERELIDAERLLACCEQLSPDNPELVPIRKDLTKVRALLDYQKAQP